MKTFSVIFNFFLSGYVFVGCSDTNPKVLYSSNRTYGTSAKLTPGDPTSEVNYSGSLMIQSIESELNDAGYSTDLVAKVVAKAQAEVSLAGTLAFGTIEEINLGLTSNQVTSSRYHVTDSDANLTVGIAAEAVAKGAITALSPESEKSLSEKMQDEGAFFALTRYGLASGVKYFSEVSGFQFRHDSRFTLSAGIATLDTVSLIATGQIKGISSIKSQGKITNFTTEAIGNTTKLMTSTLFSASSQIGMASETTAGELASNVMKTIISAVAVSDLKENAETIIAKIPESIDGFKELKLSASSLGETSKAIVKECISGIKVADLQVDTKALVSKIVTASVSGAFQAAASTDSVATATASAAKEAFVSYTSLVSTADLAATKEAAKTIFSTAISAFDNLPGWNIDVISVVSTSLGTKALEAAKEVGLTGDSGAAVVSEISVGILDSAAAMPSVKNLGVDQATLKSTFSELSKATVAGIQSSFPEATGNYTTVLDQAVDKVATNTTAPNTAPTLSATSDQVTNEDTVKRGVAVSISDAESTLSCTALTAESSNPTLIPPSAILISGTAPNCFLELNPSLNQSGSSTITLKVTDSALSATDTFVFTVNPVNDPPTISNITDKSTLEDTPLSGIAVSISDAESTLTCASLQVTSSNTSLVPSASITVSGTAPNCLIRFIPASNQSGSSTITLKVSDSALTATDPALTATDTFILTVNPVNDVPSISNVTDQSTNEDTPLTNIAVTITDVDSQLSCASITPSSSNTILVPSANITVSGTAPNCLISLTPALNQSGSSTITLTVSDSLNNALQARDTFTFQVNAVNDLPSFSTIGNLSTNEDTALTNTFTISDAETSVSCSSVIVSDSSNPNLINSSQITFSGTQNIGSNVTSCSMNLNPTANKFGSSVITLTLSDADGGTTSVLFVLTVNSIPDAPSNITLSSASIAENSGASAVVGSLSANDPDLGDTFTYSLVTGEGSTDNASFVIATNQLQMTSSADFETKSSYSVRLRATDQDRLFFEKQFTIAITNINESPTNLSLSSLSLAENSGANAVVGSLSATDPDLVDTFTYSLVAGTGSTDNASFSVATNQLPNQLQMTSSADFETKSSYSVRLRATDQGGLFFEKPFTITITNANDAPVISAITPQTTSEDIAVSVALTVFDIDGSLSCTGTNLLYTSSDPTVLAASGAITWSGIWPNCSALIRPVLNAFGTTSVTMTLSDGFLSSSQTFLLNVIAVNDPPVISDVTDKSTSQDTVLSGVSVSISDPDSSLTCGSITASSFNTNLIPNSGVTISGTAPNCLVSLTPASGQTGTSTITLTVSDESLTASDTFVLTVNPPNAAPTDISLSNLSLAENSGANALVGSLSATDPDLGETFTYSLAAGAGDTDNGSFNIAATQLSNQLSNQLQMTLSADFETKSSYSVRLRATDQGGLFFEKSFTITITNVNEAPSVLAVTNQTTNQDTPTTPIAITISDVDGPIVQCNSTYLSYTSQNTSVVAAAGAFSWSGTWPNCTAVINPVTGASGSSVISISASDGILTSLSQSFTLQVGSVPVGWYEEANFKAINAGDLDWFGNAVALSGDTAIVAAKFEDSSSTIISNLYAPPIANDNDTNSNSGAAYIYQRTNGGWVPEAMLKASNNTLPCADEFGSSVDISKNTVVVGAAGECSSANTITNGIYSNSLPLTEANSGAVYVFTRSNQTWAQQAYLKASNADALDQFGSSVGLSGDLLAVGSINEDSLQATITAGATINLDNSGSNTGAVYVFSRAGSQWRQDAYLKASQPDSVDKFGNSVDIDGNLLAVGSFQEDSGSNTISNGTAPAYANSAIDSGAVYTFRKDFATWLPDAYIKPSNNLNSWYTGFNFGSSVSLSSDTLIVGAPLEDSSQTTITNSSYPIISNTLSLDSGAAYVYRKSVTGWSQEAYLKASNANASDNFGTSVSISGDTLVVGAKQEDSSVTTIIGNGATIATNNDATNSGASYIFKRSANMWEQEAYVKASNAHYQSNFGSAVAISGDTVIIGAYGESSAGTIISRDPGQLSALESGAAYIFRNRSRVFEATELAADSTGVGSFTLNWNGSNVGTTTPTYKVVYGTTPASQGCSTGTLVYNGTNTSVSVSGLPGGLDYFVRVCVAPDSNSQVYSNGSIMKINVKAETTAPYVMSIVRGSMPQQLSAGMLLDFKINFSEPIKGLSAQNLKFDEVNGNFGATATITSIDCPVNLSYCTVWAQPKNTGELKLNFSNSDNVTDLSGNSLVIGSFTSDTYILPKGWYQQAYLKAFNSGIGDGFGSSVAISGNNIIVGADSEDSAGNIPTIQTSTPVTANDNGIEIGAGYIYKRDISLSTWSPEAFIKPIFQYDNFNFGSAVDISGDTAVITSQFDGVNSNVISNGSTASFADLYSKTQSGSAYVYRKQATQPIWIQEAYIKASNSDFYDQFGITVNLSGNTLLVGATGEDSPQSTITNGTASSNTNSTSTYLNSGAAYVYRRSGSTWTQEAYMKASNPNANNLFGSSLGVNGDTIVIGSVDESTNQTTISPTPAVTQFVNSSSGAVYVYRRKPGNTGPLQWQSEAFIKATNAQASDHLGSSVSLSGDLLLVGAKDESSSQTWITNSPSTITSNINAPSSGAGYVFSRTGTTWVQEAYLKASNASFSDNFGQSVALSGNTAVVTANNENGSENFITQNTAELSTSGFYDQSGASYIFKRSYTSGVANWSQQAYIKSVNSRPLSNFGSSVSISGDTVVVGAPSEDSNQTVISNSATIETATSFNLDNSGAVYVYRSNDGLFDPDVTVLQTTSTSITIGWTGENVKIQPWDSALGSSPANCSVNSLSPTDLSAKSIIFPNLNPKTKYGFRVCSTDGINFSPGSVIWVTTD